MSDTNEAKAKELFFKHRLEIAELSRKYETAEEIKRYLELDEREYLAIKTQQLKANFNIGIGDISYAMQRSAAWFGLHKSDINSKSKPLTLKWQTATRLEMLTHGFIKREFSLPRTEIEEYKAAGISFTPLSYPDEIYYFDDKKP